MAELARVSAAELEGDGTQLISAVATLKAATADQISFFTNKRYRADLASTSAAAVILAPDQRDAYSGNRIVSNNPYLAFARISAALNPEQLADLGVHSAAVVDPAAELGAGVSVAATATIGAGAKIGRGSTIGPGVSIAAGVEIGANCRISSRAVLLERTRLGDRCQIGAGAVLGSTGFGFANDAGRWEAVPQLGGVLLGDDVDVGSNTTVDRGALEDTVLERGVKLDNQIQIGHGVVIGEDTAIAACVGIAGSTYIGKGCTVAGGVGFVGHLEIVDNVHITGMSMVMRSISEPGVYSGYPSTKNSDWRKNTARFQKLDQLARRVITLERQLNQNNQAESSVDDK
ncbi:MAG: UDP-3-O-(3-hydroxymyristoyl)glucosamine N-acyltransferase [Immundisolibacteraceae bacterium]|nr:UDP-3-O-(3-hydroxymyristoyl)glucosamine N-acyltransferase [Immundisolibacteraceae bacterium]